MALATLAFMTGPGDLGDSRWEAAHGRMTAVERWRYALAAVGARLRLTLGRLGAGRRSHELDRLALDRVVYPDTACARAALDQITSAASPTIVNHSLRTYVWGALLGQIDGKRWDAEILYVAAMVHDLGLGALHGSCPDARCFTLDGVHGAREVFAHAVPERAERMRRAVLLHLNIEVPGERHGWEAHYLQAGAALDVVGQRHGELPAGTIHAVLAQYPRLALKQEIAGWIQREAQLRPGSRMAVLRRLGMVGLVRRAPFDS